MRVGKWMRNRGRRAARAWGEKETKPVYLMFQGNVIDREQKWPYEIKKPKTRAVDETRVPDSERRMVCLR